MCLDASCGLALPVYGQLDGLSRFRDSLHLIAVNLHPLRGRLTSSQVQCLPDGLSIDHTPVQVVDRLPDGAHGVPLAALASLAGCAAAAGLALSTREGSKFPFSGLISGLFLGSGELDGLDGDGFARCGWFARTCFRWGLDVR